MLTRIFISSYTLNPVTISTKQLVLSLCRIFPQYSQYSSIVPQTPRCDVLSPMALDMVYLQGTNISKTTVLAYLAKPFSYLSFHPTTTALVFIHGVSVPQSTPKGNRGVGIFYIAIFTRLGIFYPLRGVQFLGQSLKTNGRRVWRAACTWFGAAQFGRKVLSRL